MGYKVKADGTVYWDDGQSQQGYPTPVIPKRVDPVQQARNREALEGDQLGNVGKGQQNALDAYNVRDYEPPREKEDRASFSEWAKNYGKERNVQNYQTTMANYATALTTAPTAGGDLSLVYAYAKAMDPDSAVREGEAAAVANIQNIVNQVSARYGNELKNNGTFLPETREQLRREMHSKAVNLNKLYNADRKRYSEIAKKLGVDARTIIGDHTGRQYDQNIQDYWKRTKTPNPLKGTPGYRPSGNVNVNAPPKRQPNQPHSMVRGFMPQNAPRKPNEDEDEALINKYLGRR